MKPNFELVEDLVWLCFLNRGDQSRCIEDPFSSSVIFCGQFESGASGLLQILSSVIFSVFQVCNCRRHLTWRDRNTADCKVVLVAKKISRCVGLLKVE
ncbi:hypothetical protein CDAR_283971 [Caerostris darwini]|uniref:Uncharacterized protein n=1 Tax=Caerostris darwini TaxID=1538125 RepID=A0AAV4PJ42_9ARAC|nr:hypothetical protein CDAR_283971 [Caerostris darwini]